MPYLRIFCGLKFVCFNFAVYVQGWIYIEIGQVRGQCVVLFFSGEVFFVMSLVLDGVADGGVRAPHSPPSSLVFPP